MDHDDALDVLLMVNAANALSNRLCYMLQHLDMHTGMAAQLMPESSKGALSEGHHIHFRLNWPRHVHLQHMSCWSPGGPDHQTAAAWATMHAHLHLHLHLWLSDAGLSKICPGDIEANACQPATCQHPQGNRHNRQSK